MYDIVISSPADISLTALIWSSRPLKVHHEFGSHEWLIIEAKGSRQMPELMLPLPAVYFMASWSTGNSMLKLLLKSCELISNDHNKAHSGVENHCNRRFSMYLLVL
jgi:hypothetical protein